MRLPVCEHSAVTFGSSAHGSLLRAKFQVVGINEYSFEDINSSQDMQGNTTVPTIIVALIVIIIVLLLTQLKSFRRERKARLFKGFIRTLEKRDGVIEEFDAGIS